MDTTRQLTMQKNIEFFLEERFISFNVTNIEKNTFKNFVLQSEGKSK